MLLGVMGPQEPVLLVPRLGSWPIVERPGGVLPSLEAGGRHLGMELQGARNRSIHERLLREHLGPGQ